MSKIVIISGYFNPVHVGHLDYMRAAKSLGDHLVVIINNDSQVELKGSVPFMGESERLDIVSSIKYVNQAVLSVDSGRSVIETLKMLHGRYSVDPFVDSVTFANGGDRDEGNSPEEEFCQQVGIRTVYGVGGKKTQSSSSLLRNAGMEGQGDSNE